MPTRPSLVTIAASALTAVTSTVALSYLGVAGTIAGAVVAAILTAFANYAYTRSLVRTQVVVTQLAPRYLRTSTSAEETAVLDATPSAAQASDAGGAGTVPPGTVPGRSVQGGAGASATAGTDDDAPTGLLEPTVTTDVIPLAAAPEVAIVTHQMPVVARVVEESTGPSATAALPAPADGPAQGTDDGRVGRDLMAPARHSPRRTFALVAVTSFVVILLTLTVVELGLGRPLSKALLGVEGSGTTISRVREKARPTTPTQRPTTTPTDEPTSTPSPSPSEEPTPSESPTGTPTDAPTSTPTDAPTGEPSGEPTDPATTVPPAPPTDVPTDAPTPGTPEPSGTPSPSPEGPLSDGSQPDGSQADGSQPDGSEALSDDVVVPEP